jgi:DNA-binding NtrC family response regulator
LAASRPGTIYFGDLARLSNSMQARLHRLLKAARPGSRFLAGHCTTDGEGGRRASIHGTLQQAFGIVLEVPPLRSRPEDIPVLTRALLSRAAESRGLRIQALEVSTLELLKQQLWPGNVRQLERLLQRALLLSGGNSIDEVLLSLLPNRSRTGFQLPEDGVDLEALEQDALAQALERARGNRTRAASLLRLTRDQVRYRLAKLEHPEPSQEQSA